MTDSLALNSHDELQPAAPIRREEITARSLWVCICFSLNGSPFGPSSLPMRCLSFTSSRSERHSGGDCKHRFPLGFFSIGSSLGGRRPSRSAPPSSSLHSNTEQQPPSSLSSSTPNAKQQDDSVASQAKQIHKGGVNPGSRDVVRVGKSVAENSSLIQISQLRAFTYTELQAATKGFSRSNLLGEGGFGCVYRGILKCTNPGDPQPPKEVAVKVLNQNSQQGHKEWLAEVRFLGLVEHPNVVILVGYCAEEDQRGIQRLLAYEYMARRSLEGYLFSKEQPVLSWQQRLEIMRGAAEGLTYLHEEIEGIQVIFRDFKTSNILLAEDFTPKLSDFGLARQGPEIGATHVSTSVVGTIGYAAPEYVQTGHLTSKSDVWSFGVVLFEMLSGRRSVDQNRPKSERHLLEWVRPYLYGNSNKIHAIMDPRLEGDYSLYQAEGVVGLALACSHRAPRARPSMSSVKKRLKGIIDNPEEPDALADSSQSKAKGERQKESAPAKKRRFLIEDVRKRVWAPKTIGA